MNHSTSVRVGVIGCGSIARAVHLPTLVSMPGVTVRSVADPAASALAEAQRIAIGARAFSTPQALIEAGGVDAVVLVQTNFSSRPGAVPAWKQLSGGGALFDKGAHHVDIAAWLPGAYPESVTARVLSRRTNNDTATMECLFPGAVTMQSSFSFDATPDDRITVIGQRGRLSFDRLAGLSVELSHDIAARGAMRRARAVVASLLREPFARSRLLRADAEPSFRSALRMFVEAVRAWPTPSSTLSLLPTLTDGVRSVAVLLAASEAAERGTRVAVRDIMTCAGNDHA